MLKKQLDIVNIGRVLTKCTNMKYEIKKWNKILLE